jgi:putative transposase
MPQRKTELVNNEIYHIIAKRFGDNLLFNDVNDYYRGIFSLYEFNNLKPVEIAARRKTRLAKKRKTGDPVSFVDDRDKLVNILAFVLMPTHIHLLLEQLKDSGISRFMNKIGVGYPSYFKKKHNIKEKGYFFQDRFLSLHIKNDEQLLAVFAYIHTNPLSLIEPGWKDGRIEDCQKAIDFLENYKWSSYLDYLGRKNFPSLTERSFFIETLGGPEEIRSLINDWIANKREIKCVDEINLE